MRGKSITNRSGANRAPINARSTVQLSINGTLIPWATVERILQAHVQGFGATGGNTATSEPTTGARPGTQRKRYARRKPAQLATGADGMAGNAPVATTPKRRGRKPNARPLTMTAGQAT